VAPPANQSAYETSVYGQGLLTYSLLFGMKSGTALQNSSYVDVDALFQFSADKVKDLAKGIGGIQEPLSANHLAVPVLRLVNWMNPTGTRSSWLYQTDLYQQ
jgi:hypothetical protein